MTLEELAAAVLLIEFAVVPPMVLPEMVAVTVEIKSVLIA